MDQQPLKPNNNGSFLSKYKLIIGLAAIIGLGGGYAAYQQLAQSSTQQSFTAHARKEVKGKVISLKLLTEQHFLDYHNMFSDTVRKNLEFPKHISLGYTMAYLRSEMKKTERGEQLLYMIFDNKDNTLIGGVEIREDNDLDPGNLGCWVNENYWGKGRFQEALKLINEEYFRLRPDRKEYIVFIRKWNKRSFHAFKKFGYEEVTRAAVKMGPMFKDAHYMRMTPQRFKQISGGK